MITINFGLKFYLVLITIIFVSIALISFNWGSPTKAIKELKEEFIDNVDINKLKKTFGLKEKEKTKLNDIKIDNSEIQYETDMKQLYYENQNRQEYQQKNNGNYRLISEYQLPNNITSKINYDVGFYNEKRSGSNEELCREILQGIFKKPFPKVRPDFLKNYRTGKNMELDGYNEELKLAFEYSGIQHFEWPNYTKQTLEDFVQTRIRDEKKLEICDEKGIYVITIPYNITANNIRKYILDNLPTTLKK